LPPTSCHFALFLLTAESRCALVMRPALTKNSN